MYSPMYSPWGHKESDTIEGLSLLLGFSEIFQEWGGLERLREQTVS